jgi:integrase/recombinase XerD
MTTDLIIIEPPPTTDQGLSSVVRRQSSVVIVQPLPDAAILAGQVAPSSVRMYRRDFAAYVAFAGSAEAAIDPITLARWRAHLAGETQLSPNTINRMLAAVKRIMAEAGQQGYISSANAGQFADVPGVRAVAMKDRLKKHGRTKITPVQMRQLCSAPDCATLIGMRDAALLATMASSGARIAEVVSLTPGQLVPQGNGWMISIQGKNDIESRLAPLSREAHALIVAWMQARSIQSAYIFTSWAGRGHRPNNTPVSEPAAWKLVQKYAAHIGLEHIKPHDFRRFVGTQLARKDIRKAQKALGHKRIDTTAKHYVFDELEEGLTDDLY